MEASPAQGDISQDLKSRSVSNIVLFSRLIKVVFSKRLPVGSGEGMGWDGKVLTPVLYIYFSRGQGEASQQ